MRIASINIHKGGRFIAARQIAIPSFGGILFFGGGGLALRKNEEGKK